MKIDGIEVKPCPFCKASDELGISKTAIGTSNCYEWSITCARCDLSMGVVMDDKYNRDEISRDSEDNLIYYNGRKALINNWNNRYGELNSNRPSKIK